MPFLTANHNWPGHNVISKYVLKITSENIKRFTFTELLTDGHQYWRSERTEIKNHRGKMISPAISRSTPMERHHLIGPGMRSCGWGAGHVIPHWIQCAKGKKRLNPNFTAPSSLFVDGIITAWAEVKVFEARGVPLCSASSPRGIGGGIGTQDSSRLGMSSGRHVNEAVPTTVQAHSCSLVQPRVSGHHL